jgi:hypothetical protein
MIGNFVDLPRIVFARPILTLGELKSISAAHSFLKIVSALFEAVHQDRHHAECSDP